MKKTLKKGILTCALAAASCFSTSVNPNNSESEKGSAVCRPFFVVIKMVIAHAEHEDS